MRKSSIKMLTGIMAFGIAASMGSPCYAAEIQENPTEESRQSAVSAVDEYGNKVDTKKGKNEKAQLSQNKKQQGATSQVVINSPSKEQAEENHTEAASENKSSNDKKNKEDVSTKKTANQRGKQLKSLDEYLSGKCGENVTYEYDPNTGILYLNGDGDLYPYSCYAEFPWVLYHDKIQSMEVNGDIDIKLWMCNTKMAAKSNHLGDIDAAVQKIYAEAGIEQ